MPHTLLLADDSVTIQRVIKLTFADEDVEVMTVGDGDQAVAAIEKAPPDIVLADVAMPGRTGYDVAQHMRATPRLAHIPVVLLTGAFEPVDEARASEVGCDAVLAKPFEPEVVVSRVRELLLRGRIVTPPPAPPVAIPVATVAPVVEAPLPAAVAPARSGVDIDAYFDRLDQAFANLATSPKPAPAALPEESELLPLVAHVAVEPRNPARPAFEPAMQSIVDVFEGMLIREPPPAPAAPPPAAAAAPVAVAPVAAVPAAAPPAPERPAPTLTLATMPIVTTPIVTMPTPAASVAPAPVQLVPDPAPPMDLSEAQVEQIVNRVLNALTTRLTGRDLSAVVAEAAERLVREEIDEIKRRL